MNDADKNNFLKVGEITYGRETSPAARLLELEAWVYDFKRKVERVADILAESGRTEDVSAVVRAVGLVLREPHALGEPDRPQVPDVYAYTPFGVVGLIDKISDWFRHTTPRTRGFLLRELRKLLASYDENYPFDESVWIHPPVADLKDRKSCTMYEQLGRVDTVVGQGKPSDGGKCGPTTPKCWCGEYHLVEERRKNHVRRCIWNYMSGTKWKDEELLNLRPVLGGFTPNKIHPTLEGHTMVEESVWQGRRNKFPKDRRKLLDEPTPYGRNWPLDPEGLHYRRNYKDRRVTK